MIRNPLKRMKKGPVLLLLGTCLLMFSLHMTYVRRKHIQPTSKDPTSILNPTRSSSSVVSLPTSILNPTRTSTSGVSPPTSILNPTRTSTSGVSPPTSILNPTRTSTSGVSPPTSILNPTRTSTSGVSPFKRRGEAETTPPILESFEGFRTISNSCIDLTFPYKQMRKDQWQNVDPDSNDIVFSAYQEGDKVKVIGASTLAIQNLDLICQLWYISTDTSSIHMTTDLSDRSILPENHGLSYTATIFTCHLPKENERRRVIAVSITNSACTQPLNVISVTRNHGNGQSDVTNNFTVCVAPLNMKYSRAYELIEWVELNRILGADKFIFYNVSSASNVGKVLQSYSKLGLVEIVDWKLPMKVPLYPSDNVTHGIHYFGQIASLNDCLLRSRGRSEFVVNVDLDEFIIPRGENVTTWKKMLEDLPNKTAIYQFANVFFRKEWNDSRQNFSGYENARKYRLVTLLRLQHEKKIWLYNQRSKYIVRPEHVQILGIHTVWRHTGSSQNVPHGVALLHHYRNLMQYEDRQERFEDDIVVRKYRDALLNNVRDKWKTLPDVLYDIPLCEHQRDFETC